MFESYFATTLSAPSPTAILVPTNGSNPRIADIQRELTDLLQARPFVSKAALVNLSPARIDSRGNPGQFVPTPTSVADFTFIQLKSDGRVELGGDCGNSMLATAIVVAARSSKAGSGFNHIAHVVNVLTGFELTVDVGSPSHGVFDLQTSTRLVQRTAPATITNIAAKATYLNYVNPYVVVDAGSVSVDLTLLMRPDPGPELLEILASIRRKVALEQNMDLVSEFPKICIAAQRGRSLVARTVYLGGWHPGLPLTATFTLAAHVAIEGQFSAGDIREIDVMSPVGSTCLRIRSVDANFASLDVHAMGMQGRALDPVAMEPIAECT